MHLKWPSNGLKLYLSMQFSGILGLVGYLKLGVRDRKSPYNLTQVLTTTTKSYSEQKVPRAQEAKK